MKIVLYGLGQGLDLVEQRIKDEHEIIGYMDSYASLTVFRGKPFYKLEDIKNINFDYIVIVIWNRGISWSVYKMLTDNYGLSPEHVIPFYVYAKHDLFDYKMRSHNLEKIQGLIFGNSVMAWGGLEKELSIPFLNLAVPGSDIYYNYKTFQKCILEYSEQLKNLKYIIIDLYDYYYFNYDTSMSISALQYIDWGGIMDEHNFKKNKNFKGSFSEELFNKLYMLHTPEIAANMYKLFDDINIGYAPLEEPRWKNRGKDTFVDSKIIKGSLILKNHEDTINENVKLLDLFMEEIQKFNKDIKVIFTLMPMSVNIGSIRDLLPRWNCIKIEFNNIVNSLCVKYNALFWNYEKKEEITGNYAFFYDDQHLNTIGARAFTSILNEDLNRFLVS